MKLLAERAEENAAAKGELRSALREALLELLPGEKVWIFGSLACNGRFHAGSSDIDLAFEREPPGTSLYGLAAILNERFGRPVDIVTLDTCRFAGKIRREGEQWTL